MFYYIVLICYCFIVLLCFILFMTMQALSGYVWSAVDIWPASFSAAHSLQSQILCQHSITLARNRKDCWYCAVWVIYV